MEPWIGPREAPAPMLMMLLTLALQFEPHWVIIRDKFVSGIYYPNQESKLREIESTVAMDITPSRIKPKRNRVISNYGISDKLFTYCVI